MALDLSSVNSKLSRAEVHMQAVKHEISSGLNADTYKAIKKVNADSTHYSVVLSVKEEFPFERVGLITGDFFHNLRSALDHLVYAIGIQCSKTNPPPDAGKLAFPIADSPGDFAKSEWRIASLDTNVRTILKSVQPYNRPHPEMPPLLSLLRDVDDIDKHRLLQLAITAFHTVEIGNVKNVPHGQHFQYAVNAGILKDGTEIAALMFDRPTPNVTYDWIGDIMIAIEHDIGPLKNASRIP